MITLAVERLNSITEDVRSISQRLMHQADAVVGSTSTPAHQKNPTIDGPSVSPTNLISAIDFLFERVGELRYQISRFDRDTRDAEPPTTAYPQNKVFR